jgi:hypothetical protein
MRRFGHDALMIFPGGDRSAHALGRRPLPLDVLARAQLRLPHLPLHIVRLSVHPSMPMPRQIGKQDE